MPYDIVVGRNQADRERFGTKGTIFLGRHYVTMGELTSLSNKVLMDIARSHVILVVGKRGCLTGDAKVFTNHGHKKIKDFDPIMDKIYSFNGENFEWEKAELLKYKVDSEEDLIKIENYDGQPLVMTGEHPLLVLAKGKKMWKKAKELNTEDTLIASSYVPEVKNDKESLRIARLLGFILADGTMQERRGKFKDGRGYWYNGTKRRVRLVNGSEDILKTAKKDFEEEFNVIIRRYKKGKENCHVLETRHRKVLEKLHSLGIPLGLKSHLIRVPNLVFESSNDFKANFIKALFSCDGYVNKEGHHIVYYSKSRKFLEDLHLILTHFKIQSTIRDKIVKLNGKKFHNYQLYITDHTSLENFKKIGFIDKFKGEKLNRHSFWRMKRRKKTWYFDENLFSNKITKISRIRDIREVYDLHVPKNNSFLANGVISHNSGKSYSLSVIAEEMARLPEEISKNLSIIMLDTMGVFWTMKYPNTRDQNLLEDWNLKPKGMEINLHVPTGFFKEYKSKGLPADLTFAIKTSELDASDWCDVFDVELTDPIGVLIEKTLEEVKEKHKEEYEIDNILKTIIKNKTTTQTVKDATINRFKNANNWGLFSKKGTEIKDLLKRGEVSVLDLSAYSQSSAGWNIKNLVVGIISKKLLKERIVSRKLEELDNINIGEGTFINTEKELEKPMVWIMIDEAHEFVGKDKTTATTEAITQLLREGRQPGISLVLATQQPGVLRNDVLTQSDIVLGHRITAKLDINALNSMMQSYLLEDIQTYMNTLPRLKGAAIVLDDNSERIFPIGVRPKMSWHGGEAPSAIKHQKKEEIERVLGFKL